MPVKSPNRRYACGRSTHEPVRYAGGCNKRTGGGNQTIQQNVTQMLNYANPASPQWIDPYPLIAAPASIPCCDYYSDVCIPYWYCGDGVNGNEFCYSDFVLAPGDYINNCTESVISVNGYANCLRETQSVADCDPRRLGFKSAFASKVHHGRFGYTSRMNNAWDSMDWDCACGYHSYDAEADQTRYLQVAATVDYTKTTIFYSVDCCNTDATCGVYNCGAGDLENVCCDYTVCGTRTITGGASGTTTVDHYGNVASSCTGTANYPSTSGYDGDCNPTTWDAETISASNATLSSSLIALLAEADGDQTDVIAAYCAARLNNVYPSEIVGSGMDWVITYAGVDLECYDACGNLLSTTPWTEYEVTITGGTTVNIKRWVVTSNSNRFQSWCLSPSDCQFVILESDTTYTISNTTYSRDTWTIYSSESLDETTETLVEGNLSVPYTTTEVYNEWVALLAQWDLGDDSMMPWRTGTDVSNGPYICYNESFASPTMCATPVTGYGDTFGAPCSVTNIDRVWDYRHANYCVCEDPVEVGNYCHFIQSHGAWSTDVGTPRATQWLNAYQANNMPPHAFLGNGFFWSMPCRNNSGAAAQSVTDSTLWGCKYAEAIYPKESFSWFRPCGKDKLQISSSKTWCVTGATGNVLDLEPLGNVLAQFVTSQSVAVYGVTGIGDGIYYAERNGDYQLTLGAVRGSASFFATQSINDYGTGMVGQLRWNDLVPGLCGLFEIANLEQPTTASWVTCSLSEDVYLFNNDQVRIQDVEGLSINGNWYVLPVNSRTFYLKNSQGNRGTWTGEGTVKSTFANDLKWADEETKNEYRSHRWDWDYRSIQEYDRVKAIYDYDVSRSIQCDSCESPGLCPKPEVPPEPYLIQKDCLSQYLREVVCETDCVPQSVCISVAYWSPNDDSFDPNTSNKYWFTFAGLDCQYSTMQQGTIKQSMADPLAAYYPCPCEDDGGVLDCVCSMQQDDGTCQADTVGPCIKYYANYDQFEARCEPPDEAPTLPTDVRFGCLTTAYVQAHGCDGKKDYCGNPAAYADFPDGDTCVTYVVTPFESPWVTLLAKETCVCADGRFAETYEANRVSCPDAVAPP